MKNNFLRKYLEKAPIFLAMERAAECRLLSKADFKKPILDLGCGDGLFNSILFSESLDIGVDISTDELAACRKNGKYKNVVGGDLSLLPFKAKIFNTVMSNSVMEHVTGLNQAISEALRVLSPGGKFILTLPTEKYEKFLFYSRMLQGLGLKNLAECYQKGTNKIFKRYHTYSVTDWVKIIEKNGFKVIKTIYYYPKKVMALSDLCLPFSIISLVNKKIFKHWILWPRLRKYIARYLELLLKRWYLYQDPSEGACVFIESQRPF